MAAYHKRKGYWKKRCDSIYAKIIKQKSNWRCIETKASNVQCAHIISRSYHATRWDFDNAVCLGMGRHFFYTYHPIEWKLFINERFGQGYYEKLEGRAMRYRQWSLDDLKELYGFFQTIFDSWSEREGRFFVYSNPGCANDNDKQEGAGSDPPTQYRHGQWNSPDTITRASKDSKGEGS
ncbi:MAG TPA: hypothetical protein ENI23_15180 [bacterium]|nr:hypothetical protein [bacterium]